MVVVVLLALLVGLQMSRSLPKPVTHTLVTRSTTVRGVVPLLPWPAQGQAAVAVPATGTVLASAPEPPVPVASLTKIMTAYVVLLDHPLALVSQGATVVVDAGDQLDAVAVADANGTSLPIQPGEVLTERQLLDGLLVHSANDYADILARWDAGSMPAFVAKMNAKAVSLGMLGTHYADASGIDAGSVSTAADQLRVASAAMAIPVFAAVVAQPAVTLPLAGTVTNYVHAVGHDAVVGVKSGFTQASMGCVVLAAQRPVDGVPVLVLGAVTAQPGGDPLGTAERATLPLLDATAANLRVEPLVKRGERVAKVSTVWTSSTVVGVVSGELDAPVWPGDVVRRSMRTVRLEDRPRAGTVLGMLTVTVGAQRMSVPVKSTQSLAGPSLLWRLARP